MNGAYPRMIYHIIEDPIVVQSEEEMNEYIKKGWAKSPVLFTEINALNAKIAYYKSEIERLNEILTQKQAEIGNTEEKRGPGRPKKVTE